MSEGLGIDLNKNTPPYFIHSDVFKTYEILKTSYFLYTCHDVIEAHFKCLCDFFGRDNIIFPAFNYDFGKTFLFDLQNDPVQVGVLPEWVRTRANFFRSQTPFFSTLQSFHNGNINLTKEQHPFDIDSFFDALFKKDGTIIFYGAPFSSCTAIHYLETMLGPVLYRYDKHFNGKINIGDGNLYPCSISMHVRPSGVNLNYDWDKIRQDLIKADVLKISKKFTSLSYVKCSKLFEFFEIKLKKYPFYLLDAVSAQYFMKLTGNGRRRVQLYEFE